MRRPAAALIAFSLLAGACGGGGKKDVSADSTSSTTSTTAAGTSGSSDGKPTTTAAPGKGTQTKAGTGQVIAQPAPSRLAPKDGDYVYAGTSTDSKGEQSQQQQTLKVKTTARAAAVRQVHRMGNDNGETVRTLEWRSDGMWVLDQHSEQGGDSSATCDWNPDSLDWLLPFRLGATWSSESTCAVGDTTQRLTIEGKVVRTEDIEIAGQKVRAVVVERTNSTHILLGGTVPLDRVEKATEWISLDRGLLLRSRKTVSSSGAVVAGGTSELTLQNLDPK